MSKIRVHALAKELGISSKDLIEKLESLEIEVVNHMSTIGEKEQELVKNSLKPSIEKVEKKEEDSSKNSNNKEKNKTNK